MLSKGIDKELTNKLYTRINSIITRFLSSGVSLYDLKRYYKTKKNIISISSDIQKEGERLFNNNEEYIKYISTIINDVIGDRISENETNKANESKLFKYNDFISEKKNNKDNE